MSSEPMRPSDKPGEPTDSLERMVSGFDRAWQRGERPDIDGFAPPDATTRQAILVELIHIDLEMRLKAGEPVRVEPYLERYPEIVSDRSVVLDLIAAEYEFRRRRERVQPEEYLRRFPHEQDGLLARLERLGGDLALQADKGAGGGDRPALLPTGGESRPPAVEAPGLRVTFTVVGGPHQGKVFHFEGHDTFIVGRSKQAHFRLPQKDEYFSRVHFLVEMNPPRCRLMDMGSTNGTFVNDQRVMITDLKDGDLIQGGHTVLRVSMVADDSEVMTRHQPAPVASSPPPKPPLPAPPHSPALPVPANHPTGVGVEKTMTVRAWALANPCPACAADAAPAQSGQPWAMCANCLEAARSHPQPILGYQIIRELGRGGMGVVYLALHQADYSLVALKTILPAVPADQSDIDRFLREADILRQLQHPHIVAFREMGEAGGLLYFAMDFIRGIEAGRLLRQEGPLSISRAVRLVCQLLDALDYAHRLGFVHRDVKPANLLLTQEGGREMVKVVDFGLARVYQQSKLSGLTLMGQLGGTLAFMPPEQISHFRKSKPPVDQYAAAATLYNLLTGCHVFDFPAGFQHRLLMVLQGEPVPLRQRRPEAPEELARVIHRALAREPAQRFADVAEMRKALVAFAE